MPAELFCLHWLNYENIQSKLWNGTNHMCDSLIKHLVREINFTDVKWSNDRSTPDIYLLTRMWIQSVWSLLTFDGVYLKYHKHSSNVDLKWVSFMEPEYIDISAKMIVVFGHFLNVQIREGWLELGWIWHPFIWAHIGWNKSATTKKFFYFLIISYTNGSVGILKITAYRDKNY